jgi:hypothetical protein
MNFGTVFRVALATLLPLSAPPIAAPQESPSPQYKTTEVSTETGSHIATIRETSVSSVATNVPYASLPAADMRTVDSWWEDIKPGDEPPFPQKGLGALYEPLTKAQQALRVTGELFAVATIAPNGEVTEVKVYKTPSRQIAKLASQVLLLTPFKPAVCDGRACQMDFPLSMHFGFND